MERGLVARRRPRKNRLWIPAVAMLMATALGATSTFAWNKARGFGTTEDARRVAWQGDKAARLQAIESLFSEARGNIETLKSIATTGSPLEAEQARLALGHLRNRLND